MSSRILIGAALAIGCLHARAAAQYVEPDVRVLLECSPGRNSDGLASQVLALGDVDGDGVPDLAASDRSTTSASLRRVHVLSGADGSTIWSLSDQQIGVALEPMDWNDDGVLDVVASKIASALTTYVFSGVDGALLLRTGGATFDLQPLAAGDDLDGDGREDLLVVTPKFGAFSGTIQVYPRGDAVGLGPSFGLPGVGVDFIGDTDVPADGRPEVAIVELFGEDFESGQVRVTSWRSIGGWVDRYAIDLPTDAIRFGPMDVDGGRDLNGDGRPDFAVATANGLLVFSGFDGAPLHALGRPEFFNAVALVDDVDGDGRADIVAGAPFSASGASGAGRIFVFSGASGALLKSITSTIPGRRLGQDVREFGDLDGDGKNDLLVGAFSSGDPIGSVLVFSLADDPCVTLAFETEDDGATPLANGQQIDTEFGALVTLSSSGANAGLAIFDSTPGGPNDPALNDDMLIGTGNVLLLQSDALPDQTVPGFFDAVTDDADGGDMLFDFTLPVDPRSVLLADINPPPNLGASVTLFDTGGARRVYTIPPGWTGTYGDAGPFLLDLTTTAAQVGNAPGFRVATAVEDPGFVQTAVARIAVHMTGFGAIDDLAVCVPRAARAAVHVRNGSGTNPWILRSTARPVLGTRWSAALDCTRFGPSVATLVARGRPAQGRFSEWGEVLIDGALLGTKSNAHPGLVRRLGWAIPFDVTLCGLEIHLQGHCQTTAGFGGSKRGVARATLSNALDLVLGF